VPRTSACRCAGISGVVVVGAKLMRASRSAAMPALTELRSESNRSDSTILFGGWVYYNDAWK